MARDVGALVAELIDRGHTVAVAESLTGGLLVAELVGVAGVSAVLNGGVVAYSTAVKRSVLGVDAALLEQHGPVHPEVARQMAERVRSVLAVDGRPASVGLATTGVAGPGPQDGQEAGTVFVAVALGGRTEVRRLDIPGDRRAIRAASVSESLSVLDEMLGSAHPVPRSGAGE